MSYSAIIKSVIIGNIWGLTIYQSCAQIHYGIKAGLNMSYITFTGDPTFNPFHILPLPMAQIGAVAEVELSGQWLVQPGLLLSGRGYRWRTPGFRGDTKLYYLTIPATVMFRNKTFYAGAGPYAGIGLMGTQVDRYTSHGGRHEEILSLGNGPDDSYKRFDCGMNIEAGLVKGQFRVGVGYVIGLINIFNEDIYATDARAQHGCVSFNLTFIPRCKQKST